MPTIILKVLLHRGGEQIGIYFEKDPVITTLIRGIRQVKWSRTYKCWYLPLSRENYDQLAKTVKGKAVFDQNLLHKYLTDRKNKQDQSTPNPTKKQIDNPVNRADLSIHPVNAHLIPLMEQHLKLKSYSLSTIRTYKNEVSIFLKTIKHHAAEQFTTQRLKDYLGYCSDKLKLSEHTLHSRLNALKFLYEQVLKKSELFWDIPRPKKPFQLPSVLSKEEMVRLIKAITNLKHRTMIVLGYACGLRVSEIINIELRDVDFDRKLLFIRRAKGKKDRMVSLSPVMIVLIRDYQLKYKTEKYLFEGQEKGSRYSTRSLESIIHSAKQKAKISKSGSMHMLRHSFATHLIDKGTDVVFIQKLLGHNNIKTTLRYLHVTNKDLVNILSPLEDIKDFL
jgi:site-specific recombinase XerD